MPLGSCSAFYASGVPRREYPSVRRKNGDTVCLSFQVPDRGGRAYELEPPPPEMPSFQKRQDHGGRGGGRGGKNAYLK